jgi:hypothetical protein
MEFMTNLQSGLDEQKPSLFGIPPLSVATIKKYRMN